MTKFKVGDEVRYENLTGGEWCHGMVGTVILNDRHNGLLVRFHGGNGRQGHGAGGNDWWVQPQFLYSTGGPW